jgi:hypothetical protein
MKLVVNHKKRKTSTLLEKYANTTSVYEESTNVTSTGIKGLSNEK